MALNHTVKGPVDYTVVGTPTIVDGVASGFSASDYLESSLTFNTSNPFNGKVTFTPSSTTTNSKFFFALNSSSKYIGFYTTGSTPRIDANYTGSAYWNNIATSLSYDMPIEFALSSDGTDLTVSITQNGATQTDTKSLADLGIVNADVSLYFGRGHGTSLSMANGSIDLNETYIKVNGKLWFYGKNYASKNIAPVPSGYTYGTTTTPSIGYVDMRTQQFTAAPSGATIGRDE